MREQKVTVLNRAGVHARPSTLIAQAANKYNSKVTIIKSEKEYNAKSVIGVMTMAATYNTELTIRTEGDDETNALEAIVNLFDTKFEED
ncbi:MAG: HPr family phosphocarrier protein [Spirochaetaceae bacterium]|nr:HPr family phosphocarrier protein [Spirochaetaceae bacterium]